MIASFILTKGDNMKLKIVSFESNHHRTGIPKSYLLGFNEDNKIYLAVNNGENQIDGKTLDYHEANFVRDEKMDNHCVVKRILEIKSPKHFNSNEVLSGGFGNIGRYIGEYDINIAT